MIKSDKRLHFGDVTATSTFSCSTLLFIASLVVVGVAGERSSEPEGLKRKSVVEVGVGFVAAITIAAVVAPMFGYLDEIVDAPKCSCCIACLSLSLRLDRWRELD